MAKPRRKVNEAPYVPQTVPNKETQEPLGVADPFMPSRRLMDHRGDKTPAYIEAFFKWDPEVAQAYYKHRGLKR